MRYRVEVSPVAHRELRKIPEDKRERILRRIRSLAEDPRPAGVQKLAGEVDGYRIRVGDYRVLYRVKDDVLLIVVVRVGHRREVYRVR